MKRFRITLALFALLLTAQPAFAQETVSFQGRLTNPDGAPISDGLHTVQFQLFPQETGGSAQWEESHSVTTEEGVFSAMLGSEMPLDIDAFEAPLYLALTVDGEELQPRTPLSTVPYAMQAQGLADGALVAGQNVTIQRQEDGSLEVSATGGSGGGLASVASDRTLSGEGTSGSPLGLADHSVTTRKLDDEAVTEDKLNDGAVTTSKVEDEAITGEKLADEALVAGQNVTISRQGGGALEIAATGSGGLASVTSDATLSGDGTAGSPLQLANASVTEAKLDDEAVTTAKVADEAITGAKLTDGALVAGANVTITRQGSGAFEVTAVGGLSAVTSDGTLSGDGTAGSPLAVGVPLTLTGDGAQVIRGQHSNGHYGWFGSGTVGAGGINGNGNIGYIGHTDYAIWGRHNSGNTGHLGGSDYGAYGRHSNGNYGILGARNYGLLASIQSGYAGSFQGDVFVSGNAHVTGTLSKNGGSFKIDHPLDPANKYLSHSFVESPDMMNVYNGNVTTDENGEAVVTLPDYFEALNRDFRYQLTTIGGFAPVYIAEKIKGNQFKIAGGVPEMEVSWQVTGIRQDAWAEEHRIVVEEEKPAEECGYYLHPKLFGQPTERNLMWARDPELMRELQEMPARLEAERLQREEQRQRLPQQQ